MNENICLTFHLNSPEKYSGYWYLNIQFGIIFKKRDNMVIVDIFNSSNTRKKLNDLYLIFLIFDWKWELKTLPVFYIMYTKKLSVNIP